MPSRLDLCKRSAVLGSLNDGELSSTYDHLPDQLALELLVGAHQNSEWSDGRLVIGANLGNIPLLQATFYAVRLKLRRRTLM